MGTHNIRSALLRLILAICSLTAFLSCRSGETDTTRTTSTGQVSLYFTDDISNFKQVVLTVQKVQLINSGTRSSCNLLGSPVSMDIPRLAGLMQYMDSADCQASPYNRIHIEVDQNLELMDFTGTRSACRFTSYLDSSNKLNTLQCTAGTCTLDINGAVRRGALEILADRNNKLALDFDLKSFTVENFGDASACSVTMKVTPLEDSEIMQREDRDSISGGIFELDTTNRSCILRKGQRPFTMSYAGISETAQPGIDTLLQTAQDKRFTAVIQTTELDLDTRNFDASAVSVKARGIVQALNPPTNTFTLQYRLPDLILQVSFDPATVDGFLANDSEVEVKFSGYDTASGTYHAERVAVKEGGRETDN